MQRILLEEIDQVFCPLDVLDTPTRSEPVSINKLLQGDTSWDGICKNDLGWIINTITMTIHLPEHHQECLVEILASITLCQKKNFHEKIAQGSL